MIWVVIISFLFVFLLIKFILYITTIRCNSKVCLVGKTALITGGNSGLGLALAKDLASRGCTIIIADKDDATNTVKQLKEETHNPHISAKTVDFSSFNSVRSFAKELKQNVKKLHILVNNAGIGNMEFSHTEDGIQKIMQVNYFSHFLLTHLLLDLLLNSSPSRIIFTSSFAAYVANLSEKNFKGQKPNKANILSGSYSSSKLAMAIMSRIISKKLKRTGVTSNTCHPGLVKTNIWNNVLTNTKLRLLIAMVWPYSFGKSSEEGMQTLLHLACANEVENISGKFFLECTPVWQPTKVYNKDFCERIWTLSETFVNLKPEESFEAIIHQWRTSNEEIK